MSTTDKASRADAVRQARASSLLDGRRTLSPQTAADQDAYIEDRITVDELVTRTRERYRAGSTVEGMTTRDDAPRDELPCVLWLLDEVGCPRPAVVSVADATGSAEWGCEQHAAQALAHIDNARISKVADWDAARRLLALPWNHG